jgi:hypothetical protein
LATCPIDFFSVPILSVGFIELIYDKPGSFDNTADTEISFDIVSPGTWHNHEDYEPVFILQLLASILLAFRFTAVRVIGIWIIWHLASGIWHPASGIWHLASGIWHLASGIWHLASGIWIICIIGITSWRHHGSLGGFYSFFSSNNVTTSRSGGGRGGSADYKAIIFAVDTSPTVSRTDMYTAPGTQPSSLHCFWDAAVILFLALKTNIFLPFVPKMKIYWNIVTRILWHLKTIIFFPIVLKMKIYWNIVTRILWHLKTTIFFPIMLKMKIHWDVVIRIFKYLKTTIFFPVVFKMKTHWESVIRIFRHPKTIVFIPFVLKMKNIFTVLSLEKGETSKCNSLINCDVNKLVKIPQPGCFSKGDHQRQQWREASANLSTDICGPIVSTTTNGHRNLIVFVSQSSGYTNTYFIKRKFEVFNVLNEVLSDIFTKALAALAHQGLTHRLLDGYPLP